MDRPSSPVEHQRTVRTVVLEEAAHPIDESCIAKLEQWGRLDRHSLKEIDALDATALHDCIVVGAPGQFESLRRLRASIDELPTDSRPTLLARVDESDASSTLEAGADDVYWDCVELERRISVVRDHLGRRCRRALEMEEALLASPSDWVLIADVEGNVLRTNSAGEEITGYPLSVLENASIRDTKARWRSDHERAREALFRNHSEVTYRTGLIRADGTPIDIEVTSRPRRIEGELLGAVTVIRDVTEIVLEEEIEAVRTEILDSIVQTRGSRGALEQICGVLERHLDGGHCWVLLRDEDDRLETGAAPSLPSDFTQGAEGLEVGEGVGVCGTAICRNEVVVAADIATHPLCAPFRDRALELGLHSVWSTPVREVEGRAIGSFAVYHDSKHAPTPRELRLSEEAGSLAAIVLQRAAAESRLGRSQRLFEEIMAHSPIGIQLFDPDGTSRRLNQAMCDVFGLPSTDFAIGEFNILEDPWAAETGVAAQAARAFAGEVTAAVEYRLDLNEPRELWHTHGETRWVEILFFPICSGDTVRAVVSFARDTTQRRQREEALRQSQKMESLGVLAGGIAHDFNNLLVGMLGNASLALEVLPPGSEAAGFTRDIELASRRAAELAGQMLEYSGRGRLEREEIEINAMLEETGRLVRSTLPSSALLEFDLGSGELFVVGDPTQLRQVVMNLLINAGDSLEDEPGTIRVSTRRVALSEPVDASFLGFECSPGEYVELAVSDDGCGIEPDHLERIFDPFFSTKFAGRGLGLASVHSIVRAHGGSIRVDSSVGRGAAFNLLIPAAESPTGGAPAKRGGALRDEALPILIIDDDATVRSVGTKLLDTLGHRALAVADGPSGIDLVRNSPAGFRCVMLDLTMPGMGGGDVFDQLRQLAPDLPVLLVTGFDAHGVLQRFGDREANGFLQKPFDLSQLDRELRRVLAGKAGRKAP